MNTEILIYVNFIIYLLLTGFSIYSAYKSYKSKVKSKSSNIHLWNSIMFAITGILFVQVYIRVIAGYQLSSSEVRIYVFVAGFSMLIGMFSQAIEHGAIDGIITKVINVDKKK